MELYVDLGAHSYSIYIENNILKDTGSYIEKVYSEKKIMIISDDNVFPLYGDTIVKTLEDKYEVLLFSHTVSQPRIFKVFRKSIPHFWKPVFHEVI